MSEVEEETVQFLDQIRIKVEEEVFSLWSGKVIEPINCFMH
jgi:hypothetical protein